MAVSSLFSELYTREGNVKIRGQARLSGMLWKTPVHVWTERCPDTRAR